MTFDFTFFIIIRRRAIIECALVEIVLLIFFSEPDFQTDHHTYYFITFKFFQPLSAGGFVLLKIFFNLLFSI